MFKETLPLIFNISHKVMTASAEDSEEVPRKRLKFRCYKPHDEHLQGKQVLFMTSCFSSDKCFLNLSMSTMFALSQLVL